MGINMDKLKETADKLGLEISIGDKPGFHTQDGYTPFEEFMYTDEENSECENVDIQIFMEWCPTFMSVTILLFYKKKTAQDLPRLKRG